MKKKQKLVEITCWQAIFKTVDGETHKRPYFIDMKRIICTAPEYIMICINGDKYIADEAGNMYPIYNVVSIKWQLDFVAKAFDKGTVFYRYSDIVQRDCDGEFE